MELVFIYVLMLILPLIASINININYSKYKNIQNEKKLTGFDVARKILDNNDLNNIYIVETGGNLSDCYDPTRKTVRLSHDIYHGTSLAALAIAAHECGHAIQDKESYFWMRIRSSIFPIVSIANKIAYITLFIGFLLQIADLVYLSVALTLFSLVFQLITLPVEFNASSRAKKMLEEYKLVTNEEKVGVSKVLTSAALTYVAGVLTTLLQMLYYLTLFTNRKR